MERETRKKLLLLLNCMGLDRHLLDMEHAESVSLEEWADMQCPNSLKWYFAQVHASYK